MMMLTGQEQNRYIRQMQLPEIGGAGQQKLKRASVLVVGAGGLGGPALSYLTGAGIGTIGVIDDDVVSLSNLHRQVLFSEDDLGRNKALAAVEHLKKQNSSIVFRSYPERLLPKNAEPVLREYDIVLDCSDNFSTRYLLNDACIILKKPLVFAAIDKFQGQVSVFNCGSNGETPVTYRCLFPEPPAPGAISNCETAGVLGMLPGVLGCLQAAETVKLICGFGELLAGKVLVFDLLTMQSQVLEVPPRRESYSAVPASFEELMNRDYGFDGLSPERNSISVEELMELHTSGDSLQLIDIRQPGEWPEAEGLETISIPLPLLEKSVSRIASEGKVVLFCSRGDRSSKACEILSSKYNLKNIFTLQGGIEAWMRMMEKKELEDERER